MGIGTGAVIGVAGIDLGAIAVAILGVGVVVDAGVGRGRECGRWGGCGRRHKCIRTCMHRQVRVCVQCMLVLVSDAARCRHVLWCKERTW